MKVFSDNYEQKLLEEQKEIFSKWIQLAEQLAEKPRFIQQKNVTKYYEGVSIGTLLKYERLGLKRCEPVADGKVYYYTKELDRFMLEHVK